MEKKMKTCPFCSSSVEEGAAFCPECGAKMTTASATDGGATVDTVFGASEAVDTRDHSPSTGVAVLSFLFWIVGLILYLLWKDIKPGKATSALKGVLVRFSLSSPLIGIIFYCVVKDDYPELAKVCSIAAIVGVVLVFLLPFVIGIFAGVIAAIGLSGMDGDTYAYAIGQLTRWVSTIL